jgi:hypothetical protein
MNPMARQTWTHQQREHALQLALDTNATDASKQTGIPRATIKSWMHRHASGNTTLTRIGDQIEVVHKQQLTVAQRMLNLADNLVDDAERLRQQLFAPSITKKVVTVGSGNGVSHAEVVEVHTDQPTYAEQTRIMTSIAIAVDKIQLMTGEATSREEFVDRTAQREKLLNRVDELAARRSA